jgi:hypothetical protein
LFWFLIARRASNTAKWILVTLTAIGLLSILSWPGLLATYGTAYIALVALTTALNFASVALLFRGDAVRWLKSKGTVAPVDATVFE